MTARKYIDAQSLWDRIVIDILAADSYHDEYNLHEADVLRRMLRYMEMTPSTELPA